MAKRTKKVGIVDKYGTRYGASLRKMVKLLISQSHTLKINYHQFIDVKNKQNLRALPKATQPDTARIIRAHSSVSSSIHPIITTSKMHQPITKHSLKYSEELLLSLEFELPFLHSL
uniref:Uncharacterized protein n=1 Tax=Chelydra serpentina TaxID=8475 RepID=A0A8C3RWE5_CHESE